MGFHIFSMKLSWRQKVVMRIAGLREMSSSFGGKVNRGATGQGKDTKRVTGFQSGCKTGLAGF